MRRWSIPGDAERFLHVMHTLVLEAAREALAELGD
jgi:hypothetical protein